MNIQYLFYILGTIFIIASVWYFAGEYIAGLPNGFKLIILVVATVATFLCAELLREKEL